MRFEYYPEAYQQSQQADKKVKKAKRLSAGYSLDGVELDDPFFKFITYKMYIFFLVCFNILIFAITIGVLAATKTINFLVPCMIHLAAVVLIIVAIRMRLHVVMWLALSLTVSGALDAFVHMILSWVYCTQEYNLNEKGNGNFLLVTGFLLLLDVLVQVAGAAVIYKVNQGSLETDGICGNGKDMVTSQESEVQNEANEP